MFGIHLSASNHHKGTTHDRRSNTNGPLNDASCIDGSIVGVRRSPTPFQVPHLVKDLLNGRRSRIVCRTGSTSARYFLRKSISFPSIARVLLLLSSRLFGSPSLIYLTFVPSPMCSPAIVQAFEDGSTTRVHASIHRLHQLPVDCIHDRVQTRHQVLLDDLENSGIGVMLN